MLNLNRIRISLIITNALVLLFILIAIVFSVYVGTKISLEKAIDNELLDVTHQAKRYISFMESPNDKTLEESQDFHFFLEKAQLADEAIVLLDENGSKLYSYGSFAMDSSYISEVAYAYFASDELGQKEAVIQNDKYVLSTYKYDSANIRICTSITTDDEGNLRFILINQSLDAQAKLLQNLLYIVSLVSLIGVVLALVGSNFIAGRALIPIKSALNNQKQFIADASHELKTPLAVVRTNLDLVLDNEEESVESQKIWLNNVIEEVKRMDKMVADLLYLAKADLAQIPLETQKIDLLFLIKNTIEKLSPLASEKHQRIVCISSLSNLMIVADDAKITQLFVILIDNAIKYSPKNKDILVYVEKNRYNAVIKIVDNGYGIDKNELDKVFKRFYRVDKARSRQVGGSGLGLPIAKTIVEAHFGSISIESEQEKGTTINITLPILGIKEG